jgi:hypothetical protein
MREFLFLVLVVMPSSVYADGICPTTNVLGRYVVTSVACGPGGDVGAKQYPLAAIQVSAITKESNPDWFAKGVAIQIDFENFGWGWGIFRKSLGGQSEECEDGSNSHRIRRYRGTHRGLEEIQFNSSGVNYTDVWADGTSCTWSLKKQ